MVLIKSNKTFGFMTGKFKFSLQDLYTLRIQNVFKINLEPPDDLDIIMHKFDLYIPHLFLRTKNRFITRKNRPS